MRLTPDSAPSSPPETTTHCTARRLPRGSPTIRSMLRGVRLRVALGALACAAAATLAMTGCPGLDALECHGGACSDAASPGDASGDPGDDGSPSASGIFCGASGSCAAPVNECCYQGTTGTTTCN